MKNILLIEDNKDMALALMNFFSKEDFKVEYYDSFEKAQRGVKEFSYDCYLLDLNLPEATGYDAAKYIRQLDSKAPIIAITARDSIEDKLKGFEQGFNDYVVKPFDLRELMARVNAHISQSGSEDESVIFSNKFKVDRQKHQAFYGDSELKLTLIEFNLLFCLVKNANMLVRTDDLIEYAWGSDPDIFNPPVRMHISNLRKKIGDDNYLVLETIPGLGYRLNT